MTTTASSSLSVSVKRIGLLVGTTRAGRISPLIAQFVLKTVQQQYNELFQQGAKQQSQGSISDTATTTTSSSSPSPLPFTCAFELIDIASFQLPLLDDIILPGHQKPITNPADGSISYPYANPQTRLFSAHILSFSALIICSAQYNWSIPASLKNALDHLYHEWRGKPTVIVTYGHHGGNKCSSHLVQVCEGSLKMGVVEVKPMMVLKKPINSINDIIVSSALTLSLSSSPTSSKPITAAAQSSSSFPSFANGDNIDIVTVLDNHEEAITSLQTAFRQLLHAMIWKE